MTVCIYFVYFCFDCVCVCVLPQGSKRVEMKCESLSTTQGSYPGRAFPLSDHEALSAHLLLVPSDPASQQGEPESGKENTGTQLLTQGNKVHSRGLYNEERKNAVFSLVMPTTRLDFEQRMDPPLKNGMGSTT